MKIAVLADIHGNKYALEEVLKDIKKRDITLTVCVGDLVGYAPFPNEVIQLIRENNIPTIMGNYDDSVSNMLMACGCDYKDEKAAQLGHASLYWTQENTTDNNLEFLKALPLSIIMEFEGIKIKFVHGSPRRINEYLFEHSQELDEVTRELAEDVLVCGHTHKPFTSSANGKIVINAGSVGKPKHGNPNGTYMIIALSAEGINTEVIEVAYDYEKTAAAIIEKGLPAEFAELIRSGNV